MPQTPQPDVIEIFVDGGLLSTSLGNMIRTAFEQADAVVNGAIHTIENTIIWKMRGVGWVLVIIDESTPFRKHAREMRETFLDHRIVYVIQNLEDVDSELVNMQTTTDYIIVETLDAEDTIRWVLQLVTDTYREVKRTAVPKVRSGRGASDTWRRMLELIFRVSAQKASAIVSKYPTLQSLCYAYSLLTPDKAEVLLVGGDCGLHVATSKRVYTTFTHDDPKHRINVAT